MNGICMGSAVCMTASCSSPNCLMFLWSVTPFFYSGVRMCVERPLKEAVMVDSLAAQPDKGMIGKTFKKDAKAVQEALAALTIDQAEQMDKALTEQG